MSRLMRKAVAILLTAALCLPLAAGCAEGESLHGVVPESNTAYRPDLYPYAVHTESAVWYLSQADIDLMGLDALCEGLSKVLKNQEADFADARAALAGCLTGDVPPVVICTDFSGHADISNRTSAYYNAVSHFIKVFHSWDDVSAALLHEYVHYLTFACTALRSRAGFWAEGIAEYVSRFLCENRMSRAVNMALSEEEIQFYREKGAWDEQAGCIDEMRLYYGVAEVTRSGFMVGHEYYAVSNSTIERTERIQRQPKPDQLSYHEAACVMAYLMETYGEDFVYTHWDTDPERLTDAFGKDFQALYAEWAQWNTRRCAELGLVME